MKSKKLSKTLIAFSMAAAMVVGSAAGAGAGAPTCADYPDTDWANHGAHVLTYVNSEDGARGGQPAHRNSEHEPPPGPGATFCLVQADPPPVTTGN